MNRKLVVILMIAALIASFTACDSGEETTLTGMVVSVDGTVISLVEMDADMGGMNFENGERPEMPEGMENFDGTLPEGETAPNREEGGEPPQMPDGNAPSLPEGETMPQMPDDMTMPEDGGMPEFGGENSGKRPGFGSEMETTEIDIGNAHISVEIDEGKASGSLEDITAGSFVTITMNGKGEVTNVLVSSQDRFGGGRGMQQGN